MGYVPVPKDLTNVKTKVALNMTARQLVCFSLAAVVGVPFYLLTRGILGADVSAILMVTIMLPFFFLAMYEKDGLPFEKVMMNIIRQKYIYPPIRVYKTENIYAGFAFRAEEETIGRQKKSTAEKAGRSLKARQPKTKRRKK